jgi:dienelactone hydrolase
MHRSTVKSVWHLFAATLVVLGQVSKTASAEQVSFPSVTFANISQAARGNSISNVVVSADLNFPASAKTRYPVVVIAHASGGFIEANEGWFAAELRRAGFATLTYDSFKTRKWGGQTAGGDPRVMPSNLADVFGALNYLAGHPKIQPQSIAVVGFSLGGDIAHMAAFERLRSALKSERKFAAHVSLYPGWTMGTRAGPRAYTGAPVLLLLGEKDELTPTAKVQGYLAYLDKGNTQAPIETVIYPGAYHAWTNPRPPSPRYFPDHGDGAEKDFDKDLWDKCFSEGRGYTTGFSAQARAKSLADTIAFLRKSLRY